MQCVFFLFLFSFTQHNYFEIFYLLGVSITHCFLFMSIIPLDLCLFKLSSAKKLILSSLNWLCTSIKTVFYIHVGLFLNSLFCSTDISVYLYKDTCHFDYYIFRLES